MPLSATASIAMNAPQTRSHGKAVGLHNLPHAFPLDPPTGTRLFSTAASQPCLLTRRW